MLHQQVVPGHTLELLKEISPLLSERGFYLAGGTALALRLGHRISVDLDFFHPGEFNPGETIEELAQLTGEKPEILQQTSGSICVMLRDTKVELLQYDYPMIQEAEHCEGIPLSSLPDNAAMKLSALIARGSKKDFVAIAALMDTVSLEQHFEWCGKKFPKTDPFVALKSLTWFEDAKNEPDPVFLNDQIWSEVKSKIIEAVK